MSPSTRGRALPRPPPRLASFATALVSGALVVASCKGQVVSGELITVVNVDTAIPKDIDLLHVQVLADGVVVVDNDYPLGSSATRVPATLGVVQGADPGTVVSVRVVAREAGKARVIREAKTTVPTGRIAALSLGIEWLCDGTALEPTPGNVQSTCGTDMTCVAGQCVSTTVDSSTLPNFEPDQVFGGGTGDGDGQCFDTIHCFAQGAPAALDLSSCTAALSADPSTVSYGIRTAATGICSDDGTLCVVPLDGQSDEGWFSAPTSAGARAVFPPGVCQRLTSRAAIELLQTTSCPAKTAGLPTCGPWSASGGGDDGTNDASAPLPLVDSSAPNDASPASDASDGATSSEASVPVDANLCGDGIKDGTETDVDCGGSCAPCAVTKGCSVPGDCRSSLCTAGACACPAGMTVISGTAPFCIDATEVSNGAYTTFLAATKAAAPAQCAFKAGVYTPATGAPPSSQPNVPVANVDWCDADEFCLSAGKHLCTSAGGIAQPAASTDQWYLACSSGGTLAYPYGAAYVATSCNGTDYGAGASIASGQDTACVTSSGVLDLSGNLAEWEDACDATTGASDTCLARGGSFASASTDLTCAGVVTDMGYARSTTDATLGFRCCYE